MGLKISLLFELIAKPAFSFIRFLARKAGYKINISKFVKNKNKQTALLNLNIGAGSYEIENFLSLDIYTKHYYKNKKEFLKKRIEYNIRKDMIPFKDSVVDNIYISHVIEHIEEPSLLIKESFRILRPKGKCIFLTPSWLHNSWGPFYLDHTHVTPFTQFSLKNILKMSGYENVKVLHFRQLPFVWRLPILKIFPKIISKLPLRYSPMYDVKLPNSLNKLIRFSNEVMLLAYGEKL